MKEIVVLSGKGGTGKTTVMAAMAHLASQKGSVVLADTDVDAANLALLLAPVPLAQYEFTGSKMAAIAADRCSSCGACLTACRFDAIRTESVAEAPVRYQVDPLSCEGCAACYYRCPIDAITMHDQVAGTWSEAQTPFGPLVHAHLFAGQENSGKLVAQVKQRAREIAEARGADYLLIDGPPGIGCPVIAACSRSDLALLVVEPTAASQHDLQRVLGTTRHFGVPSVVCINKHDLNAARASQIEAFCQREGIEVIGRIPFDISVTEAMVAGRTVTECCREAEANDPDSEAPGAAVSREIRAVWRRLQERVSAPHKQGLPAVETVPIEADGGA